MIDTFAGKADDDYCDSLDDLMEHGPLADKKAVTTCNSRKCYSFLRKTSFWDGKNATVPFSILTI